MSKHSRQAKKELVCAICNRGVGRASISGVTGAGMNWSLRVIEQIEILPKSLRRACVAMEPRKQPSAAQGRRCQAGIEFLLDEFQRVEFV